MSLLWCPLNDGWGLQSTQEGCLVQGEGGSIGWGGLIWPPVLSKWPDLPVVSRLDNSTAQYMLCNGLQSVFVVCVGFYVTFWRGWWSVVSKLGKCVLTMCLPPLPCGVVKPGLIAVRNDAIKAESGHKKGWSGCNIILGPGDTACSTGGLDPSRSKCPGFSLFSLLYIFF